MLSFAYTITSLGSLIHLPGRVPSIQCTAAWRRTVKFLVKDVSSCFGTLPWIGTVHKARIPRFQRHPLERLFELYLDELVPATQDHFLIMNRQQGNTILPFDAIQYFVNVEAIANHKECRR